MQPVGAGKILTFEMILAALELPRSLYLFRKCFRLFTTGDWFTVKARPEYAKLITHAPGTIKFWRFHYFFVDATFIPSDKTALLGWTRDTSNKKECSRFIRKINVLPAEHMLNQKHLERLRQVSIPYKSYAKCEAILVVAKISQDWEGDAPTLVDESTGKFMGLWESMGVDHEKVERRQSHKPCLNDEILEEHVEGSSHGSPPSRRISFSPERQNLGIDGTSLCAFSSLPTEEESDKAMGDFFEKEYPSTSSPTCGLSLGGSPSGKRGGGDLISSPPKRSMPPFEAFKSFTSSSFTSNSMGPLRLSFVGGGLEETINDLEPMRRVGFHCTEYPALQSITANEWNDLRRASAFNLGYDDSTRTFSYPPSRAGSTLVPHPTQEFRRGLGNDYYMYPSSLKLKDDLRDPEVARHYADSVVPPLFAAETSFLSLTHLARLYDTHVALSFNAGAVLRDSFLRELVMLKKKIDGLESEMSMVYGNLSDSLLEVEKEKDNKRCLEQEVQRLRSKLGVSEARVGELEGERTRGKELETHAERSTQLRRDTLLAFPRLFRLVMDHPDVMGVLSGFYRDAVVVGRHPAALDLVGVHPSIDPTSLPFYDESIPDKARKAEAAFVEKSFPILDAIVKDPGASLKDIESLLTSRPEVTSIETIVPP